MIKLNLVLAGFLPEEQRGGLMTAVRGLVVVVDSQQVVAVVNRLRYEANKVLNMIASRF